MRADLQPVFHLTVCLKSFPYQHIGFLLIAMKFVLDNRTVIYLGIPQLLDMQIVPKTFCYSIKYSANTLYTCTFKLIN